MNKRAVLILLFLFSQIPSFGTTWHDYLPKGFSETEENRKYFRWGNSGVLASFPYSIQSASDSTIFSFLDVPQATESLIINGPLHTKNLRLSFHIFSQKNPVFFTSLLGLLSFQSQYCAGLLDFEDSCFEYCSDSNVSISNLSDNSFLKALVISFSEHRPIEITPDAIWILILQGVSSIIHNNPNGFQDILVKNKEKVLIQVRNDDFVIGMKNPWNKIVEEYSNRISIFTKNRDLFIARFSTSSDIDLLTQRVMQMNILQSYFRYRFVTQCGIPKFYVRGTETDWEMLIQKVKMLEKLPLGPWPSKIVPILQEIKATIRRRCDPWFWRSIFKFNSGSGGPYMSGWISLFFPYITDGFGKPKQNSMLNGIIENVPLRFYPKSVVFTPFQWIYHGRPIEMQFFSGIIGLKEKTPYIISPIVGYGVIQEGCR